MIKIFEQYYPTQYNDYYVSKEGNVISTKKGYPKRLSTNNHNNDGYGYITICNNDIKKKVFVHRLIAETFIENPNPNEFKVVNHINGDKSDNRVENLEYCSHSYNNRHAYSLKVNNPNLTFKDKYPYSNLNSEQEVLDIYNKSYDDNYTYSDIAKEYNIPLSLVKDIKSGHSYNNITKHEKERLINVDNINNNTQYYKNDNNCNLKRIIQNVKPINGYEDYLIGDLGDIFSYKNGVVKQLKTYNHSNGGYEIATLYNNSRKNIKRRIHRLVYETFKGPIDSQMPIINHRNGDVHDNSIENLVACSASGNMKHQTRILGNKIKLHESAKTNLTPEEVKEIYYLANNSNMTLQEIGDIFNISRTTVSNIKYGVTWSDITEHNTLQTPCISYDDKKLKRKGDKKEYARGERISKKLTNENVKDIFIRTHSGENVYDLADEYNISTQTVYDIKNRINWTHITDELIG